MIQKTAHPILSYSLIFIQFVSLIVLLTFEPWFYTDGSLAIQILAIMLGLWAVTTMRLGHFNIVPDPLPDITLVTTGPYRWIRHPMYASLIFFFLPVTWHTSQTISLMLYCLLVVDLVIKLHYEERLLTQKLPDYSLYQTHSKKLIPYLF